MAFSAALAALLCSVVANGVLAYFFVRKRRKKEPIPTIAAEDLLHDLTTRGLAILKVEVIDPRNLLLRSPRT